MTSVFDRIDRQMDEELSWILEETISLVFRESNTVKRIDLCKAVARSIGSALLAREGEAAKDIELSEFDTLAWDAAGKGEDVLGKGSERVSRHIAEMCVAFVEIRKMGMRSPYREKMSIWPEYDPFASEGGFCNPMKLKMMD
jgi:hypothetical protein